MFLRNAAVTRLEAACTAVLSTSGSGARSTWEELELQMVGHAGVVPWASVQGVCPGLSQKQRIWKAAALLSFGMGVVHVKHKACKETSTIIVVKRLVPLMNSTTLAQESCLFFTSLVVWKLLLSDIREHGVCQQKDQEHCPR